MEPIDIETFRKEWDKIESKMEQISTLGDPYECGASSEGYRVDNEGITHKSSTYFSGCGTDNYSFTVSWDEINNPIQYFEEKAIKFHNKQREESIQKQKDIEESQRVSDLKKLKELQAKYGNQL